MFHSMLTSLKVLFHLQNFWNYNCDDCHLGVLNHLVLCFDIPFSVMTLLVGLSESTSGMLYNSEVYTAKPGIIHKDKAG